MSQMTSCLDSEKSIPLPVEIDSHAIVYEWNDTLWLFINRFSEQKTHVYNMNKAYELALLTELSMMSSTVVSCKNELVVTGSNSEGKPVIIGINSEGDQIWSHFFSEINPITWPVTSCGNEMVIAWQESINTLEVGILNTKNNSLQSQTKVNIETPPVTLYSWKNHMHGIWLDRNQIHDIDLLKNQETIIDLDGVYSNNISFGITNDLPYLGWTTKDWVYFKYLEGGTIESVKVENLTTGEMSVISGTAPLLWIQSQSLDLDESRNWKSVLVVPGMDVYNVNGYVYAVGWWQNKIVVAHSSKLVILHQK